MQQSVLFATILAVVSSEYEVILRQINNQKFPNNFVSQLGGVYNVNNPNADLYSIVGSFNTSDNNYRDENDRYKLRLTYYKGDGTVLAELKWAQKSWVAADAIVDADLSSLPSQAPYNPGNCEYFKGLARSTDTSVAYLDGNGKERCWWNVVGMFNHGNFPMFKGQWITGAKAGLKLEVFRFVTSTATPITTSTATPITTSADPCEGITCPDDLVCSGGKCKRNCDVLNIDSFLTDCSAEFKESEADITKLQNDVGNINTRFATVDSEIAAIKTVLDQISAQSEGAFSNVINDDVYNKKPSNISFISNENKDILIISLLLINILIITIGLVLCFKNGLFSENKKLGPKYIEVYRDSDAEVQRPINQ